ncbi:DUF6090 family protein [Spongiivirga citrea]|uniref:Uncharacterized protein n=1 Tax=Spongiivirga citrea TaxID=1481457 RepID=A0A6M0CM93_9FLAO|nr:DUF6090 family protein [Spongiivirga citrea]NER18083.1 hypothetical protein [Spongiivirga citrea]
MKIFRKIRFQELTKSNFGKYIVYAIGEIILVVIGILIALYVNNKKEEADQLKLQRNHLVLIKEELENNLIILDKENKELHNIVTNIKDLVNLKNSDQPLDQVTEVHLSELLFLPLTRSIEIDYENGAFNNFVTSGNLEDIKNDSIKTILRSWNRKIETVKLQEYAVNEAFDKAVNFVNTNGSLKTVLDKIGLSKAYLEVNDNSEPYSNKFLLRSRQFENILIQYLGVATQLLRKNYLTFKSDIELLIRLIDVELIQ